MPAHKSPLSSPKGLAILQEIWKLLVDLDWKLYPDRPTLNAYLDQQPKQFCIHPETFAVESQNSFKNSLQTPFLLRSLLLKKLSTQDKLETSYKFNYLGPNQVRDKYLAYLEEFFWKHQDSTDILEIPNQSQVLEDTAHILPLATQFKQLEIRLPSDFFDEKTNQNLLNLSQTFEGWEFDPYYLANRQGNIQWQIQIKSKLDIRGVIFQDKTSTRQHIFVLDLTKEQFTD
jgi:hypothetical protein